MSQIKSSRPQMDRHNHGALRGGGGAYEASASKAEDAMGAVPKDVPSHVVGGGQVCHTQSFA